MRMVRSSRPKILAAGLCRQTLYLAISCLWVSSAAHAMQQGDPPRLPATATSPMNGSRAPDLAPNSSRRAAVTYSSGLLTVAASNSSLNGILREIARQTGMKVTGGVAEDRVFGTYGPASPSAVLAALLDGTGSNLLIVQDAARAPTELILTPRVGAITPPNPAAPGFNDSGNADGDLSQPIQSIVPQAVQPPLAPRSPNRSGTGAVDSHFGAAAPSSTPQQPASPPGDASTSPAPTTTPATPDGTSDTVKTPQQIFEQLQKLRQQQSQQPKP